MNKLLGIRLLPLLSFLLTIGFVVSCKKDNNTNTGNVQLLSFGPTGAMHGDTLHVIGNNLNVVTAIEFTGKAATVPQSAFIQQSSELILLLVPKAAEQGFVTLKTPQGDIVSKTKLNLQVVPAITSMTAEARPGQNVTITGQYLNWVTRVTFAKDKAVDSFVSKTIDKLVVTVPMDAQTGPLVISYSGTKPMNVETSDTVKVTLPMATAFAPNPIKQLQDVTITGTDLDLVKQVIFTNVSTPVTTFVSQTATKLVVNVPSSANKGKVTLVAASGVTTQSTPDLDIILPVITSFSPNQIKHQQNLTITGTNLDLTKSILFTGTTTPVTTFVSQSATQIVVKVPAGANTGKISVVTAGGVSTQASQDLQLILPSETTMSPNPVDPGANLTITGTNLELVTAIAFVGVTNPVTAFVSQSTSQIVVKVPTGTLKGNLTFSIINSTVTVQSSVNLDINGGLPPLADFAYAIYTDALQNGFGDWSYTDTHDLASTAIVRQGSKSIKAVYGGNSYQGLTFHNDAGPATASYTKLEFSIFGAAGSGGKKLNVIINGNYTNPPQVTIAEGEWKTFSLNISDLPSPSPLKEVQLQGAGFTGTVYVDHVGLR